MWVDWHGKMYCKLRGNASNIKVYDLIINVLSSHLFPSLSGFWKAITFSPSLTLSLSLWCLPYLKQSLWCTSELYSQLFHERVFPVSQHNNNSTWFRFFFICSHWNPWSRMDQGWSTKWTGNNRIMLNGMKKQWKNISWYWRTPPPLYLMISKFRQWIALGLALSPT